VVLTLGTPVDSNMDPDLSQIESSIQELAPHLGKGQTVILRSTVNPGTTEWVQAKLEDEFGYRVGQDIFLAFCPERIAEGRALKELHQSPGLTAGPCLFKDGFFLINQLPFTELISTAWKINESVPLFMVSAVKAEIDLRNANAAILGAAFKADSDDDRQSLTYKVAKALVRERATVRIHDPYVPGMETDVEDVVRDADVVFVAINHRAYKEIGLKHLQALVKPGCLICDIWNVFGTDHTIFRAGNPDPSASPRPHIAMGRIPD
jgi:UDP-N-acetyl-D-mannosaminuronate dehydrogenase